MTVLGEQDHDIEAAMAAIIATDPTVAREALQLATAAVQAARPKMWLRLAVERDQLRDEVASLRSHLNAGVCGVCGHRF